MRAVFSKTLTCATFLLLAACASINNAPPIETLANLELHEGVELKIHSAAQLVGGTPAGFSRFKSKNLAYGAMFIRPNGSGFRSYTGLFSLEDALFTTEIGCRIETGRDCILYATLEPSGSLHQNKLPADLGKFINRVKEDQKQGQYVVIAVDRIGNTATYYSEDLAYAKREAVKACERVGDKYRKDSDQRFAAAFIEAGVYECRVFGTYR